MEVAAAAASDLKRVHLELGGNAPVIVCDDADLEAAAEGIAAAGFFNAGQDCTAATRVIVAASVHDRFVDMLVAQAQNKTVGGLDVRRRRSRSAQQPEPARTRAGLHRATAGPRAVAVRR